MMNKPMWLYSGRSVVLRPNKNSPGIWMGPLTFPGELLI